MAPSATDLGEDRDQQRAVGVRLLGDRRQVDQMAVEGRRLHDDAGGLAVDRGEDRLGARRVGRQRDDARRRPMREWSRRPRGSADAGRRRAPPSAAVVSAVGHQHRLGGARSSRHTWRRWRPPCRSGARPGSGTRTDTAACPARSPAGRACRRSGTPSAGSGDRRSPARGGDRRRRRRRTAPSRPRRSSPPSSRRMRSTSISPLRRRQVDKRVEALAGRDVGEQVVDAGDADAGQHRGAVGVGVGEIAHGRLPLDVRASRGRPCRRPHPSGRRARRRWRASA